MVRGIESKPRDTWLAQAFHNRMIAAVLAMVVVIPLVFAPADDRLVKGAAAIAYEGFALLLAVMLVWRSNFEFSWKKTVAFLQTSCNVPVVLFFLLALYSACCVPSNLKGFAEQAILQLAAGILLYFVLCYQFEQSKHLWLLMQTLLFLAAAISLITLAGFLSDDTSMGRTLYGDHQPLGSVLMMLFPLVVAITGTDKNKLRQLVGLVISVLTAGSLMLSFTRSAWIGTISALIVLSFEWLVVARVDRARKGATGKTLGTRKHEFVLPAAMTLIVIGFVITVGTQNHPLAERAGTLGNYANDKAIKARQLAWHGALIMIRARPLTGWGEGMYPVYQHWFTGYGTNVTSESGKITLSNQAHDFYLQTAAELGIPGLILVLAILLTFVVSSWRRLPTMDDGIRRALLMGSTASVVAFAVDAYSSPSWQYGQFAMFLWLALGIGTCCMQKRTNRVEQEN